VDDKEGKGLIFVGRITATLKSSVHDGLSIPYLSIARPLDNPYISKYLWGAERAGQKSSTKKARRVFRQVASSGATLAYR